MGGRSAKPEKGTRKLKGRKRGSAPDQFWLWLGRGWVILALNSGPALAQDLAAPAPFPLDGGATRRVETAAHRERVPVIFGGQVLGHVDAEFLRSGAVSLDADDLYRLADPVLDQRERDLLRALSEDGRLTPFQMHLSNLALEFEDDTNALVLSGPAEAAVPLAPVERRTTAAPAPPPLPHPPALGETATPLMWNGVQLGFVDVHIESGRVSFPADRFAELAGEALDPRARELLPVLEVGGRLAPFALNSVGVRVEYDEATGVLVLQTPPAPVASAPNPIPEIQPASAQGAEPAQLQAASASPTTTPPAPPVRARAEPAAVYWRDTYLGDTSIAFASDGSLSFDGATFLAMTQRVLTDAEFAALRSAQAGERLSPVSIESAGVRLTYSEARRALVLETPNAAPPAPEPVFVAPSTISAIVEVAALAPAAPLSDLATLTSAAIDPEPTQPNITPAAAPAPPPTARAPATSSEGVARQQTAAQREPQPQRTRPNRQMDFVYPLMLDGRYLGDVPVRFEADGGVSVASDRVVELIEPLIEPAALEVVRGQAVEGRLRPFEDPSGLAVVFDEALQELQIVLPGALRRLQTIAISGSVESTADEGRFARPAPVAAFVNVDLNQSYNHDVSDGREPLLGLLDGGVRLFGDSGFALQGRATYREDAEQPFARGETRLIYDHVPSMISATLGDLRLGAATFQSAPALGGLSVERLFSLQPHRNFRPAGRRAITLESRTNVIVVVNGAELRRLDLMPGRYNIEDFPFAEGANDVQLVLEDEFGRREVIDLSGYFDLELLEPGLSEFSYAIGAPATSEAEGITYDSDVLMYSMFHRIGVLSNLTLGVNAQGRDDAHMYGGEVLWASPIGTIGLDVAHSENPLVGEGDAALLRYEIQPPPGDGFSWRVGLSSQWQTEAFAAVDADAAFSPYVTQNDASIQLYEPTWGTLTFGYSYDQARPGGFDRTESFVGYSRRLFGRLFGSIQVRHQEEGDESETSGAINLSLRLGARDQVTFRHNTDTNASELDWRRSGSYGVGGVSTSLRFGQDHNNGESSAGGAVSYYGNRFETTFNHDARTVGLDNDEVSQRSSLRFGTAVAYAGERVAVGRPVRGAFAIVRGHESLENSPVILGDIDHPRARSGWLGPALVSDLNPYSHEVVGVDVEELPPGYDLGSGQLDFLAYRGAGYDVEVGSAASVTVLATLLDPQGAPIPMMGGELRSLDEPEREPVQAFTNRTGRFAAAGVAPGRYMLVIFTEPALQTEITIAEGSVGLVQLGTINMQETP